MSKLRIAIAAVMALSASTAFGVVTNTPGSFVNSDLFLVVVNQTTGKSEAIDLGVTATALTFGQTFNVDPNLASNLGAGTLSYQLVAGDLSAQGPNGYSGSVLYTSSNNTYTAAQMNNTAIVGAVNSADLYLSTFANSFSAVGTGSNIYQTYLSAGTTATNWGPTASMSTAPGKGLGLTGIDFTAAVGSPLSFYTITSNSVDAAINSAGSIVKTGIFTLTGSSLSYAAAVPLPAALWLLGSGVLGLGAARRRRLAVVA
ncbi:MAG: VPLPA-CTERM sorting domain-containing protein [Thermoleophilia bacterium]